MTELEEQAAEFVSPKFHGEGASFFKIWIVNTFLTIVTFGIYGAWAKVRTIKFFNNSTELMGSRFDFHGDPMAILKGRIIMVVLGLLYFSLSKFHMLLALIASITVFLVFPWVFIKSLRFKLNNTSYRNIRFSFRGLIKDGYSIYFKYLTFFIVISSLQSIALYFIGFNPADKVDNNTSVMVIVGIAGLLNFIAFLILLPQFYHKLLQFIYNNIYFGNTKVSFESDYKTFRSHVFNRVIFSYIGFFIAYMVLVVIGTLLKSTVGFVAIGIFFFLGLVLLTSLMTTTIINYIWNRLLFGDYETKSNVTTRRHFEISFVNMLGTLMTLGLFYPRAKVRLRKYVIENKLINITDFDQFTADVNEQESAVADEISDALDFDFEIGL